MRPPAGSRSVKGRIYAEQLDVSFRLAPFAVLCVLFVVLVVATSLWNSAPRFYLSLLSLATISLSIFALAMCWRWRRMGKPPESRTRDVNLLILVAAAYGVWLSSMPVMLFVGADADFRLLIACTTAGLIAIGMSVSAVPWAAICFSGSIIVGAFYALAVTGEPFYILIAILLALYALFIILTMVHLSKVLLSRIISEIKVEHQKDVISLLLFDFEENASDWIWEIDVEGRIRNPSARLAQIFGKSFAQLDGAMLSALLNIDDSRVKPAKIDELLWKPIANRATFRDCLLPIRIAGETRWWSLTGKATFDSNERFSGYRGVGSDVTAAKQAEERLSYLARFDALTDLPNRTFFHDRLLEAIVEAPSEKSGFAVLCLDLDEFKYVNDTFGHAIGDRLLAEVADRLRLCVDKGDVVARLSGDEFAILARSAAKDRASGLAAQIVTAIAAPMLIEGIKISLHVSVGIAVSPCESPAEIMHRADLALYRTKNEGRNGFRFYDAEMDAKVEARRSLEADLRGALARDEFVLHFQPVVAAQNLKTTGFEALLRWRHPIHGLVPPATFIPIAEENACIVAIGEWVIREACRVAATWPDDIKIAVNLSPIQLRYSDLCAIVASALEDSGLAARRLELEITESMLLEANVEAVNVLKQLQKMGVCLALDDFGTGYSSLSYLRNMPFNKIKIDRSFVKDLPNDKGCLAIIRAVIGLGGSLGMTITAEGIETREQLACMRREGCDLLQGYLFSAARPQDQLQELMNFGARAAAGQAA
ncbi:bifunctional diguanylate cyclase/phosphodiesterase [Methylocapsa sp. S129]|uniref:putative bifunctional diguanylate cyclase/phosphodiesterase n=1 Tax=Methylocapsa sp. S129 TaxID=1641869 RepID=UPI00131EC29B|nr:bifunctional diguanylate cyclase/phosphodiesterase [Methylocapsa sp. S129]